VESERFRSTWRLSSFPSSRYTSERRRTSMAVCSRTQSLVSRFAQVSQTNRKLPTKLFSINIFLGRRSPYSGSVCTAGLARPKNKVNFDGFAATTCAKFREGRIPNATPSSPLLQLLSGLTRPSSRLLRTACWTRFCSNRRHEFVFTPRRLLPKFQSLVPR